MDFSNHYPFKEKGNNLNSFVCSPEDHVVTQTDHMREAVIHSSTVPLAHSLIPPSLFIYALNIHIVEMEPIHKNQQWFSVVFYLYLYTETFQ